MDEDFVMDDQVTCGSTGTRHRGQQDSPSATLTGLGQPSATSITPAPDVYIPQSNSARPPSPTTTTNQSMARPLGRTRTLGQMGRTESLSDVLSTPVPSSDSGAPMPLLQHRESSTALDNDDDDDTQINLPDIRIDGDWDNGTQTVESQDVPMSTSQVQNSQQPSAIPTGGSKPSKPSSKAPGNNLIVNTTNTTNARRFPSPVPTEPEDPDPEFISNQLAKQNIKVRDFGMCPPYTTSAPSTSTPSATRFSQRVTTSVTSPLPSRNADDSARTSQNLGVQLTPETFNPREALGEFEFRLRQLPRTLPIPGKTLRRLIEIGWVTENEVESRCSQEDLEGLDQFDSRNRARLLRLTALREQRAKDLNVSPAKASRTEENWGFTPTGAYPYVTFKYDAVPTVAERNELVTCVRQMFVNNDRFIRMAMATEKARERDRIEAEEVLMKRKREEEEKERIQRERVDREMLQGMRGERDEEMQDISDDHRAILELQPPAEITAAPITSRKRSPHQAWAEDEDYTEDNDIEDLDTKRLRLARSQSEAWYEQERRLQQELQPQNPGLQPPFPQPASFQSQHHSPPSQHPRSRPQTPRRTAITPQSHNYSQQSNSQSQHSHSRTQSQPTGFVPPEIQYPAPLSTYDPELYPDAASVIESQSQSQGRPVYLEATPPASPTDDERVRGGGGSGGGGGDGSARNSSVGRGIGLGEDGEEDNRPNALKRSPKKGLKRSLTRGRTLVEIC